MKTPYQLCPWTDLPEKTPQAQQVNGLDLVVIRYGEEVSVLYGRCLHRGALMADGYIEGHNLICGVHGWGRHFGHTHEGGNHHHQGHHGRSDGAGKD